MEQYDYLNTFFMYIKTYLTTNESLIMTFAEILIVPSEFFRFYIFFTKNNASRHSGVTSCFARRYREMTGNYYIHCLNVR